MDPETRYRLDKWHREQVRMNNRGWVARNWRFCLAIAIGIALIIAVS